MITFDPHTFAFMKIEISNGELIDKLTILEIKLQKITDGNKLANIRKEYTILKKAAETVIDTKDPLFISLLEVNLSLWEIEDRIRELERKKDFGKSFVETARSVYFKNDLRAKIKHQINQQTNSDLFEEKSYEDY